LDGRKFTPISGVRKFVVTPSDLTFGDRFSRCPDLDFTNNTRVEADSGKKTPPTLVGESLLLKKVDRILRHQSVHHSPHPGACEL
jgi:hypothetical protein